MKLQRIRFGIFAVATIVGLLASVCTGFIKPGQAHAAPFPNFTWQDYSHISVSGAPLTQTAILTIQSPNALPSVTVLYTGSFVMTGGCRTGIVTLTYDPNRNDA